MHIQFLFLIKKLRNVGVSQDIAEVQGQELEHVIGNILKQTKKTTHEIVDIKDTATKSNLEKTKLELQKEIEQVRAEIHKSKYDIILWVAGIFIASGILQHFFK